MDHKDNASAIVDEIKATQKSLSDKLELSATKDEIKAVQKQFNDLADKINAHIKVGEDRVLNDPKCGYKHVGEFATDVMKACEPVSPVVSDRLKIVQKAVTGVSQDYDPSIGFLFPPSFSPGIKETAPAADSLLSRVRSLPIDKSTESITLTYVDDQNRTAGIRGGQIAYWKAEADQMTGTKPKLRQVKWEPQELYGMAYATDKSLRNSPIALGQWLTEGIRESIAFKIGDSIINGDGAGKPRGLLNSPSKIEVAKETSQGPATINHVNIEKMWKRMPHWMRGSAVWLANQDIEDQLSRMARSAIKNDGTGLESADTPGAYNEANNTIKGRPVVFTEYNATLGTVGDLILWAPQHYVVVTKTGQGPEMSMHLRFDYAETAFRFIYEIDGKTEFPTVFTPNKGSTTRSDVVVLATRS